MTSDCKSDGTKTNKGEALSRFIKRSVEIMQ